LDFPAQSGPTVAFIPPEIIPIKYNFVGVLTITGPPLSPGQPLEVVLVKFSEFLTLDESPEIDIVVVIGILDIPLLKVVDPYP
jgi:hypothetical protein